MQREDFQIGVTISYDNIIGDVQFVCDDYITFCLSERPTTCGHSLHPTCKVAMLVYTKDWVNCTVVDNNKDSVISPLSIYKAQEHRYSDIQ